VLPLGALRVPIGVILSSLRSPLGLFTIVDDFLEMSAEPQALSANGHGINGHGANADAANGHKANGCCLRARQPSHKEPLRVPDDCNSELHPESTSGHETEKEKKTFGRTPSGRGKYFDMPLRGFSRTVEILFLRLAR
jgi:hypothetical protein